MSAIPRYEPYFPFDVIRDEQRQAIEFTLDAFLTQNKKFVILEMGTGCGKSGAAIAIARTLASLGPTPDDSGEMTTGAYVLTTQKILQAQYENDFGPTSGRNMMLSLTSASNYQCRYYPDMRCSDSRRLLNQLKDQLVGTDFHTCCKTSCPYVIDKENFKKSPIGITNFSYFLAETMYAKQLKPRSLLIIDECHNAEQELGRFVEVSFSERFARSLGCRVPAKFKTTKSVIDWISGPYRAAVTTTMATLERTLSKKLSSNDASTLAEVSKRYEMLDKHICKVNRFIVTYQESNWVLNTTLGLDGKGRKFEFKPIDVSSYGYEHLYRFGTRVVMMSATIVDKDTFCRSIGIDPNDVAFLHVPSPFPPQNRPVHYLGVGSMSRANIDKTLPNMAQVILQLLDLHKDEKGIIHCVNYRVAQYIVDVIKSPRLMLHGSDDRDAVIEQHKSSQDPTVLVSPSMTEGVDLADDASRFQILCKVPFPYLGDKVVQMRKDKNKSWYACQTARSVIQAMGRSVRNDSDHATSYILDSDWQRFYRDNSSMFPSEFVEALTK